MCVANFFRKPVSNSCDATTLLKGIETDAIPYEKQFLMCCIRSVELGRFFYDEMALQEIKKWNF